MITILRYLPAVLVAATIAFLSLMENPNIAITSYASDTIWHSLMYMSLVGVAMLCANPKKKTIWKTTTIIWIIASLYGGSLELLQTYCTISRTGSWSDTIANTIGAGVGGLLMIIFYIVCKKNKSYK